MGEVQLTAAGTLEIGKDGLDLQMEDLTATGYGETLMQMSAVYALGAYQAPDVDTSAVTMILTMSEDELTALEEEIFENVMTLAGSLDLPDLSAGNTSDGDYEAGYDTGYQDGFSDGYDAALAGDLYGSYRESLAYHGHDESLYDGYFISGYCDGYYEGYYEGIYSADPDADPDAYHGYRMGYAFGYDDGYADGDMDKFFGNARGTTYDASLDAYEDYDDEYLAGYQDGYPTGYDDGYTGAVYQID